ncbi:hypothetical protein ACOSQ3_025849 [Xanthoceras sorbifolium]
MQKRGVGSSSEASNDKANGPEKSPNLKQTGNIWSETLRGILSEVTRKKRVTITRNSKTIMNRNS